MSNEREKQGGLKATIMWEWCSADGLKKKKKAVSKTCRTILANKWFYALHYVQHLFFFYYYFIVERHCNVFFQ